MTENLISSVTAEDLAHRIGATVRGDGTILINDLAALGTAGPTDLAYVAEAKYRRQLAKTRAGAVILVATDVDTFSGTALVMDNPRLGFARAAQILRPEPRLAAGIHPTAIIDPGACVAASACVGALAVVEADAVIGERACVGPRCFVGARSGIGNDSRLVAAVTVLADCRIGKRCLIHPGAVIGGDGFGYARHEDTWVKVPQLGHVIIGNDVEIGANTAIDRGALDDTVIQDGVKLDNLIQVGHNVHIGAHTAVAGCVGIAGSTRIGSRCMIGGGAGIGGHLEIGDDVMVMGRTSITNSILSPGIYSSTMSAQSIHEWRRNAVRFRHLDDLARRLKKLEEQIKQMLSGDRLE